LGRDGIGEKGGLHLYAFVGNNAVNGYDILGHDGNSDGLPPGVTPANAFQYGYSQRADGSWYFNYGTAHNSYNGFGYLSTGGQGQGGAPSTMGDQFTQYAVSGTDAQLAIAMADLSGTNSSGANLNIS